MTKYVDFGDTIIIKTSDFFKRVEDVNPTRLEEAKESVLGIDTFKYTMNKNSLGMLSISEEAFDKEGSLLYKNDGQRTKIPSKTIFHLASLDLATLHRKDDLDFIPNTIDTKVKLSEKTSVGDGDVFSLSLSDFTNILKSHPTTHVSHINQFEALQNAGLTKVLLSFHYEDDRGTAIMREKEYSKDVKPNPYTDMVVDVYITDDKYSFFKGYTAETDLLKIQKEIKYNKQTYELEVQDFIDNNNPDFEKSKGFNERIEFHRNYTERYQRTNSNIINVIKDGDSIDKKMSFVGNFLNNEKDFINVEEIINISKIALEKEQNLIKSKTKVKKPKM